MNRYFYFLAGIILLFAACAGIPHPTVGSRNITDSFGFCHAGEAGAAEREFLASLGADTVRLDITWARLQEKPGDFDFSFFDAKMKAADEAGVNVLGILVYDTPWIHENSKGKSQVDPEDFPAWLTYVEAVAERYGDRVEAFEVWNEPNYRRFWTGTDEDFFHLTTETVKTLNQVAPDTPVLVGALVLHPLRNGRGYLRKLLESGAADDADAISVHCYALSFLPNAQRLTDVRQILDSYGFEGELWVTEMGIPTGGDYPHAISPEKQGIHTAKWIPSAFATGIDRIFWYELYDDIRHEEAPPGTSSEAFFGVSYRDFELKGAGEVIKRLVPDLTGSRWAPDLLDSEMGKGVPSVIYPFDLGNSHVTAVAWSKIGRHTVTLEGFSQGARIYETATGQEWTWTDGERFILNPEPIIIKGLSTGGIGIHR